MVDVKSHYPYATIKNKLQNLKYEEHTPKVNTPFKNPFNVHMVLKDRQIGFKHTANSLNILYERLVTVGRS